MNDDCQKLIYSYIYLANETFSRFYPFVARHACLQYIPLVHGFNDDKWFCPTAESCTTAENKLD